MTLDTNTVTSFVVGLAVGVVLCLPFIPVLRRRVHDDYRVQLGDYEETIADLRQERADDRETNRRLRHELAIATPDAIEAARVERDAAGEEADQLRAELVAVRDQLGERDRALREARLAIHDIRVQLERGDHQAGASLDGSALDG